MNQPATIEDAPHHLKLLTDYGKTVVTLSLALLTLSVTFTDKLVKPPFDIFQAWLLGAIWASLVLTVIAGLMISGFVNGVSYAYMAALRIAFPDPVETLGKGEEVEVGVVAGSQKKRASPEDSKAINDNLSTAGKKRNQAYDWARFSLFTLGLSSLFIAALGGYSSIYRGVNVDASAAVDSSTEFVSVKYKLPKDAAQFRSLAYDEKVKTYTVEIRNKQAATEEYNITIDASSGNITKVTKLP